MARLLEYEVWTRVHALGLASLAVDVANALALVNLVELTPGTLERALRPFPVRTLDALHLATAYHVHTTRAILQVAAYDRRLALAAAALGLPLADPDVTG